MRKKASNPYRRLDGAERRDREGLRLGQHLHPHVKAPRPEWNRVEELSRRCMFCAAYMSKFKSSAYMGNILTLWAPLKKSAVHSATEIT